MPAPERLRDVLKALPSILYYLFYGWASYTISKALIPRIGERIGFDTSVLVPQDTRSSYRSRCRWRCWLSFDIFLSWLVGRCCRAKITQNRHLLPLLTSNSQQGSGNTGIDSEKVSPTSANEKDTPVPPRPMRRDSADATDCERINDRQVVCGGLRTPAGHLLDIVLPRELSSSNELSAHTIVTPPMQWRKWRL
uniref:Uncharacterized protein n=1 Tax=Mycena chlorophos TaxID=658473 RepID=A0ABQ0LIR3_MYCCL|nr:predicted protein [Mycena chlorophos]